MSSPEKRMLLELERFMRTLNREVINPVLPELSTNTLEPALRLVARARAQYLGELFKVAGEAGDEIPSDEQLKRLQRRRVRYEELLKAAQALETAIERGYLDVSDQLFNATPNDAEEPPADPPQQD